MLQLAGTTATAIAELITTLVDAGSGAGVVKVYTGALPTDLDPTGDTLLATFTLADPAAAAAAAGIAAYTMASPITATVAATGDAGWFRLNDSTGAAVLGGNVGVADAAMIFSSISWISGGTVSLTAGTVEEPDAA